MKRAVIALALLIAACRTARPAGEEAIQPLTATTSQEAAQQLAARRDQFRGGRSIVRIRAVSGAQTQSARAQLQVDPAGSLLITVYTPLNTTAARLYIAGGQAVFLNDIDRTAWQGSASDLAGTFGFVAANPTALAFLLLGLPPRETADVSYAPTGLQSVRFQDLVVAYDPPVHPPQRVVVVRGTQRVEIDHLESFISPPPLEPLIVPADYRCCVMP